MASAMPQAEATANPAKICTPEGSAFSSRFGNREPASSARTREGDGRITVGTLKTRTPISHNASNPSATPTGRASERRWRPASPMVRFDRIAQLRAEARKLRRLLQVDIAWTAEGDVHVSHDPRRAPAHHDHPVRK